MKIKDKVGVVGWEFVGLIRVDLIVTRTRLEYNILIRRDSGVEDVIYNCFSKLLEVVQVIVSGCHWLIENLTKEVSGVA